MGLVLVTPPAVEPVTKDDLKLHLRIDGTDEDAYVEELAKAAREQVEIEARRALIEQTWDLFLDQFPGGGRVWYSEVRGGGCPILLPRPPLIEVVSIKYVDTAGVEQTLAAAKYQVDAKGHQPGRIYPAYGESWPSTRADTLNAVTVRFKAGYGAAASGVPRGLRRAVLFLAAHWYEHREPVLVGTIQVELPFHVEALVLPHRVWTVGTM